MKIILNSSSIIFLSKLDYLKKTLELFNTVYIPNTVFEGIDEKNDATRSEIDELINHELLSLRKTNLITLYKGLNKRLGKGESEVISLAIELNADYVILGDDLARKEARRLGLNVRGTLAIIKKLIKNRLIDASKEALYDNIQRINFRVKKHIFDEIFSKL